MCGVLIFSGNRSRGNNFPYLVVSRFNVDKKNVVKCIFNLPNLKVVAYLLKPAKSLLKAHFYVLL